MNRRRFGAGFSGLAFVLFLGALAAWNEAVYRLFASIGRPLPSVYEACRYVAEEPGKEEWLDVLELLSRGEGDCEDLACAEVGRLRSLGVDARPGFHARTVRDPDTGAESWIYHVFVIYPGGRLDDPSRALGMLTAQRPE
jgi:hypothetical protein